MMNFILEDKKTNCGLHINLQHDECYLNHLIGGSNGTEHVIKIKGVKSLEELSTSFFENIQVTKDNKIETLVESLHFTPIMSVINLAPNTPAWVLKTVLIKTLVNYLSYNKKGADLLTFPLLDMSLVCKSSEKDKTIFTTEVVCRHLFTIKNANDAGWQLKNVAHLINTLIRYQYPQQNGKKTKTKNPKPCQLLPTLVCVVDDKISKFNCLNDKENEKWKHYFNCGLLNALVAHSDDDSDEARTIFKYFDGFSTFWSQHTHRVIDNF